MSRLHVLCLTLVLVVRGSQSKDYMDSDEWSYQGYLGQPYTMYCNDSEMVIQPPQTVRWRIPDLDKLLPSTYDDDKYTVAEKYGIEGMALTIKNVQASDPTTYICEIMEDDKVIDTNLKLLNYDGPLYLDPFDEYRWQFIVAVIAAAAILVAFVAMCLIYHFRYRPPEHKLKKHHPGEFHANSGYSGSKDTVMTEYPVTTAEKVRDDQNGTGAYVNPQDDDDDSTKL